MKCWRFMLGVQLDDKCKEMLKRYLLFVMFDLKCKDDSVFYLIFYYFMNFNIMIVKVKVIIVIELIIFISVGDLLFFDLVLSCLYFGDYGKKILNLVNQYQFDKVGILILSDYVFELGYFYLWVQKFGGFYFFKEQFQ